MIEKDFENVQLSVNFPVEDAQESIRTENNSTNSSLVTATGISFISEGLVRSMEELTPYVVEDVPHLKVVQQKLLKLSPKASIVPDFCVQVKTAASDDVRVAIELKGPS